MDSARTRSQISPGAVERHFAFIVPLDSLQEQHRTAITVRAEARSATLFASASVADPETAIAPSNSGLTELRWNAARYPMVLVRDAATNEILSLARGGSIRLASGADRLELLFSHGVRSPVRRIRFLR